MTWGSDFNIRHIKNRIQVYRDHDLLSQRHRPTLQGAMAQTNSSKCI